MTESKNREILVALQRGIPLAPRPFSALAETLGISEDRVLENVRHGLDHGSARRFGAVFDARRLGYRSELCALTVPAEALERVGAVVAGYSGVTHAYLRGHPPGLPPSPESPNADPAPNLWFTLAVGHETFDGEIARLEAETAPFPLLRFPAVRRFKIDVVFDPAHREAGERAPGMPGSVEATHTSEYETLTDGDRDLVRALQGNVPVRSDFFAPVAVALGTSVDAVIERLRAWRASGTLRRIALIVRHRRIGFVANAMCVWPAPDSAVVEAGRRLAAWPEVTHAYQRLPRERWPYTLYGMIHTGSWDDTRRLFERISADIGLHQGRFLGSLREFKKTSMAYF